MGSVTRQHAVTLELSPATREDKAAAEARAGDTVTLREQPGTLPGAPYSPPTIRRIPAIPSSRTLRHPPSPQATGCKSRLLLRLHGEDEPLARVEEKLRLKSAP